eukprot:TRINITY_DN38270_c0_g1_i1.p1 TRINITY_DN38270_c0_g1~~TRINITY_DN38270_c0_g1_i1.p1  ORF type:complete len:415 (-),score=37.72 TRINITY_DN38270_c0_g1_i1:639-1697(-)
MASDEGLLQKHLQALRAAAVEQRFRVPDEWVNGTFENCRFCSSQLLCSCPEKFWKRLRTKFADLASLVTEVSISLSHEDLLCQARQSESYDIHGSQYRISLCLEEADYTSGGVGRFAYKAAEALSSLLANGHLRVKGLRVLELGSGIGLAGLAAAQCGAEIVLLTDYSDSVLGCASENASKNSLQSQVRVSRLDWTEFLTSSSAEAACQASGIDKQMWAPDVIIGADVCYQVEHAEAMLRVLSHLFSRVNPHARAIIVNGWPNKGLRRFECLVGARDALTGSADNAETPAGRRFVEDDEEISTAACRDAGAEHSVHLVSVRRMTGFSDHAHHVYEFGYEGGAQQELESVLVW